MSSKSPHSRTGNRFTAKIEIIGINPFVFVPREILETIFADAGRSKSPIPVSGILNGVPYQQTLVRYQGDWRLYINTSMLPESPKKVGEHIEIAVAYDPADRTVAAHPLLLKALEENREAKAAFERIVPSLRNEIIRYISHLKTAASVEKNVQKAIDFLLGKGKFIGRDGQR